MLKDLILATVTPFEENGNIDYKSLDGLLEFWRANSISRFFICGTTGEMLTLSLKERKEMTEYYLKSKKSGEEVCVHVGGVLPDEVIELGKHAFEHGANSISIVTPHYYKISQHSLLEFYRYVIKNISTEKDIYLYNIPQCTGNDLLAESVATLAKEFSNVKGLKYSFFDPNRTQDYILQADCDILSGTDHMATALIPLGVKGIVTGAASVYPEVFSKYLSMVFNKQEVPLELQQLVTRIVDILGYGNMSIFKEILNMKGLCTNVVRRPLVPLTSDEKTNLKNKVEKFEKDIKKYLD